MMRIGTRLVAGLCLAVIATGVSAQRRGRPARPPAQQPAPPRPAPVPAPPEPVLGRTAPQLVARFGPPALDQVEGPARKFQFLGTACVLDLYLYPPREGRGEAVVTHVDARLPDGRDADPVACASALQRVQP